MDSESAKKIVKLLDKAVDADVWSGSMILRVIHKRLKAIRDRFANDHAASAVAKSIEKDVSSLFQDQVKIYITLYLSTGKRIDQWEKLLKVINTGVQGRPAYRDEVYARNYVNSKQSTDCDGYIVMRIDKKYLLDVPEDKVSKDALGQAIVSFLPRALKDKNIVEFVHKNLTRYAYQEGKLRPYKS
ncbi:MAG TPA: Dot/Icm secretion system protein IcmQ [Gammaproteobacteria bacterium]|nr:Dot/Icm secretion system protein IcmQ [Gammaproteobacteria bacterium]